MWVLVSTAILGKVDTMKTYAFILCSGMVALSGGCSVALDETGETGEAADPVTFKLSTGETVQPFEKIQFDNGTVVGFFETQPGDLTVYQWGANLATPPVTKALASEKLKPAELYQRLTKNAAPETLVAAQNRAEAMQAKTAQSAKISRLPASVAAPTSKLDSASSTSAASKKTQGVYYYDCVGSFSYDEWFNCSFCYGSGDYDYTWMWVSGSGNFQKNDMNHTFSTVSVYGGGSVHFNNQKQPWYSWSTTLDTYVANGFWVQAEMGYDFTDFDTKSRVDNASGDSYHWCSYGWSI